jgi:hypothetical protein
LIEVQRCEFQRNDKVRSEENVKGKVESIHTIWLQKEKKKCTITYLLLKRESNLLRNLSVFLEEEVVDAEVRHWLEP